MLIRLVRATAVAVFAMLGVVAVPTAASAQVIGTGGWTKITTPSKAFTYHFNSAEGAVNHLTIAGKASPDVPTVNIYCGVMSHRALNGQYLATNVDVADNGTFTVDATVDSAVPICRLMALPTFLADVGYLGAFTGPLMYSYTFGKPTDPDSGKVVTFASTMAFGTGAAAVSDPSLCGVVALTTVELVDVQVRGPAAPMCTLSLLPGNFYNATTTASGVRVDGNNAYLPAGIYGLRHPDGGGGLTLPQPAMTASFTRNSKTGDVTIIESAHYWRCDGNAYPPTAESCTTIVDTGITFKRVLQVIRGNHQVVAHDSYISNDGKAHTVVSIYTNKFARPGYGGPGFIYPKHVASFKESTYDQVVTGFGTGPGTVLVRSDHYASSTDPDTDTQALTWSRPPSKLRFSHFDTSAFALPYTFHVARNGTAKIAFAVSEAPLTADAKALAAKAVPNL